MQHPDSNTDYSKYTVDDFLEALDDYNNSSVSDAELSSLWKKIQDSNKKTKSYRKFIYIGSIAASIMIMLLAIPYVSSVYQSRKPQDILLYAQENSIQKTVKKFKSYCRKMKQSKSRKPMPILFTIPLE